MGTRELHGVSSPHPVPVSVCARVLVRLTASSARILRPHHSSTLPTSLFRLPGHLTRRGLSRVGLLLPLLQALFETF